MKEILLLIFPIVAMIAWFFISISVGINAKEFKQYEDDEHEVN